MNDMKEKEFIRELSEITDEGIFEAEEDIASKMERIKTDFWSEILQGVKQDRKQRGRFSMLIFVFVCVYMSLVITILFLCGFGLMRINTTVLVTLISTTTANIISVFIFVTRYLFAQNEDLTKKFQRKE